MPDCLTSPRSARHAPRRAGTLSHLPPHPRLSDMRAHIQDKPFDLHIEQSVLAEPCPKCGYHFPTMPETRESTAVFKDVPELAEPAA